MKISRLLIDSRKIFSPEGTLFIALKGLNHDGHKYIEELYKKGVRVFVVEKPPLTPPGGEKKKHTKGNSASIESIPLGDKEIERKFPSCSFIFVDDTLRALQAIAENHRLQIDTPLLAITGSNGKTVVKEWIFQILGSDKAVIRSPRSFNSQVGVPLSLWLLDEQADLGIIEAGISKPGEMEWLQKTISPNSVLITNIGQAHQQNFDTITEKLEEKLRLCESASVFYYCRDHQLIHDTIKSQYPNHKTLSWGANQESDLKILSDESGESGRVLMLIWKEETFMLNISFADDASFENAMHATLFALSSGISIEKVAERIESLTGVSMRLEVAEGINNCLLIDDAYNLDLNSLEIALDFLNQQGRKKGLSKTVILSDILQSGLSDKELYKKVANLIKEKRVDRLICIGQSISRHVNLNELNTEVYNSTTEFLQQVSLSGFKNEAILLKGARYFSFERIRSILEQQTHRTVLEVNLDALTHNLHVFRKQLKTQTMMMVMVKAFSYGSGSFEIANLLQQQKVNYLGVAYADEGVDLRLAGITLPIMVMNPDVRSFAVMLQYGLEPEIYNSELLTEYNRTVTEQGMERMPVHIKIDTGMSRLGFFPEEIPQLIETLKTHSGIFVKSAFSHLAGSEDSTHDIFTKQQIEKFREASKVLRNGVGYPFIRHILNSAGIERFPQAQFEMVRMGIGLYGISAIYRPDIKSVISLKTYITQIKNIPAFETIGYGRQGVLKHDARVAVIPVGYADGLNRKLGNEKGKLLINGRFASIVGNVCMDMCMADITDINAKEGDEVTVFGEEYTVTQIAETCDTIPYEILTGIGRRVKRVYFSE